MLQTNLWEYYDRHVHMQLNLHEKHVTVPLSFHPRDPWCERPTTLEVGASRMRCILLRSLILFYLLLGYPYSYRRVHFASTV